MLINGMNLFYRKSCKQRRCLILCFISDKANDLLIAASAHCMLCLYLVVINASKCFIYIVADSCTIDPLLMVVKCF